MITGTGAVKRVVINEGGFQDDRNDRGNWTSGTIGVGQLKGTKYGISAMTYPNLDIKNLTVDQAVDIYTKDWWNKYKLDQLNPAVGYQVLDAAVNHGASRAIKMLQEAVGFTGTGVDGIIGPKTIAASNAMESGQVVLNFLANRLQFMTDISTFDRYGKGWSRRVAKNMLLGSDDIYK
ncbi:N-acetylmuramidase [Yersinia phage YerA41]|nr:N-acetylmuramidase [Yersinia phage YerA41]